MTEKWLQERSSSTSSVGNCIQRVVGSDSQLIYELFNELTT